MDGAEGPTSSDETNPVEVARVAIWRLFEQGYVDEDMATASLLAVDLGTRRAQSRAPGRDGGRAQTTADAGRRAYWR